jgi:hypothetical protein
MVYIAARQVENISDSPSPVVVTWLRELLPEVRWLLSQLRDARAEADDLRTRLAAAEQERDEAFGKGFEQVRRRCVAAEERADRAEAALAAVRELLNENERHQVGLTDVPLIRTRAVRSALAAAEQDEPALPESMLTGPATFEFDEQDEPKPTKTVAQLLREVAERDPEAHNRALGRAYGVGPAQDEPKRCEHGVSYPHVIDRTDGYNFPEMNCPGPVSQSTERSEQ